jgi:hypothetical protein
VVEDVQPGQWDRYSREPATNLESVLTRMLAGCEFASCQMPWGRPGPIRLPESEDARFDLTRSHLKGGPATVFYTPAKGPCEEVDLKETRLFCLCPATDRRCRWVGIDLDGVNHGNDGLVDPLHTVRTFASAAEELGLLDGLMVAPSRSGVGRHLFLLLPSPTSLADAVLGLAAWTAHAWRIADRDVTDYDGQHAFRNSEGIPSQPGQAGAIELIPRSDAPPPLGWSLALPREFNDPFTDHKVEIKSDISCSTDAWSTLIEQTRRLRRPQSLRSRPERRLPHSRKRIDGASKELHPDTVDFLNGNTPVGRRNQSLFATVCNLLGHGMDATEVEKFALDAGINNGLSHREAVATIQSALRTKGHG